MTNLNSENVQSQNDFKNKNNNNRNNFRGKYGNNRENGGFRIRLSDNEMKSVKLIQEEFQLKSTVAVLGFSVRTLSEMLGDAKLKENILKIAKNNQNSSSRVNTKESNKKTQNINVDPFARPKKKGLELNKEINPDEK